MGDEPLAMHVVRLDVSNRCLMLIVGSSLARLALGKGPALTNSPGLEALGFVWDSPGVSVQSLTASPRHPSVRSHLAARLGITLLTLWSLQVGAATAKGPVPVPLGTAGNLAILAKTGVSSVPASSVTGDVGVSPAAATYLTGFSLVADSTNVFATSIQLVGKAFAANYAVPTPSNLTTAVSNMESAYTNAAGRPTPNFLNLGTGNVGGKTLVPGLYKWTSAVTMPADVILSGGPTDVWIFQVTGDLSMSAAKRITLLGGALAKNVFWQVAGRTTIGTGAHFEGVLLCKTDVTLQTGATMNGRILSQTNVALQQATVTQPAK
jgi:hypothetical protein